MSLQKELLENIRQAYPNSRSLDDLFAISDLLGHKQSLCERKLRILVHSGLIEVLKDERGYNKAYKFINIEPFERIECKGVGDNNGFYELEVKPDLTQSRLGFKLPAINL